MLACVCQPVDAAVFRTPTSIGTKSTFRHANARHKLKLTNGIVITKEPSRELLAPHIADIKKTCASNFKKTAAEKLANKKSRLIENPLLRDSNSSVSSDDDKMTIVSVKERVKTLEDGGMEAKVPPKSDVGVAIEPDVRCQRTISVFGGPIKEVFLNDGHENKLPGDGVQLTLHELRAMACRQQTQIDGQQQMLAAKEQRLRWLKEQEVRQQRVHAESERLRRLRDRVDAQELKLRKLRALRGQVDNQKQNNISLTSDLDSIRALFNEKEKELSMAVAKVEELTRQLEELRRGRSAAAAAAREPPPASALELDKLRRELMYRNKLNEQQNLRLSQQREALTARQEEMSAIDKRISELQERLHRKRMLNQQLASQISATYQKAAYHQLVRLTGGSTDQTTPTSPPNHYPNHPTLHAPHIQQQLSKKPNHPPNQQHQNSPPMLNNGSNNLLHQLAASYNNSSTLASMLQRGNIAAVEPYNHIPAPQPKQPTAQNPGHVEVVGMNVAAQAQNMQLLQQQQQQQRHSPNINGSGGNNAKGSPLMGHQGQHVVGLDQHQMNLQQQKQYLTHQTKEDLQHKPPYNHSEESDDLFKLQHLSKSDPKYQTLPYNTKFTVNLLTSTSKDQSYQQALHTNQMILHNKESPNNSYNQQQNYNHQQNNFNKDQSQSMNQIKDSPTTAVHHSTNVHKDQYTHNMSTYNQHSPQIGKDVVDLNGNNSKSKNVMAICNVLQIAEQISGGAKMGAVGGGLLQCAVTSPGAATLATSVAAGYQQQKPSVNNNQIASTNINKMSNIYQTSSTKVQPVEPQILSNNNSQQIPQNAILNTINSSLINSSHISTGIPPPLPPSIIASSSVVTSATNTAPISNVLPINSTSTSNIASIISSINNNTLSSNINSTQSVLEKGLVVDKLIVSPKPALPPKPSPPQNTGVSFGVNNAIKQPPRQMQNQLQVTEQQKVTGDDHQLITTRETSSTIGNDALPPPPPPLTQPPPDDDVSSNQQNSPPKPQAPPKIPISSNNSSNQQQPNLTVTSSPTVSTLSSIITSSLSTNIKETSNNNNSANVIKAKPLSLRKQQLSEQPKLRTTSSRLNGLIANSMQQKKQHHQQTVEPPPNSSNNTPQNNITTDLADLTNANAANDKLSSSDDSSSVSSSEVGSGSSNTNNGVRLRHPPIGGAKKGNLKNKVGGNGGSRRVSFDPLALLLDASLEGELELVKKTATQVANPSAANDEGITALHNAICAGHLDIVRFLVGHGCDVNAPDSDGWTPLHCAASCNNVAMVRFLVERGACIFAATLSDRETAAEKCEEDEEGFDGCSEYLYSVQEKLGILSNGAVYAVFDYAAQNPDELGFRAGQQLTVLRKGDETEREWWWCRLDDKEGYVPRNLLGLYPRVVPNNNTEDISY